MRLWVISVALTISGYAHSADAGMFLCGSPSFSGDLWAKIMTVQNSGVQVDRKIMGDIAAKLGCPFAASENFRPTAFVPNELAVTDGTTSGWVNVNMYILYANRHFMK